VYVTDDDRWFNRSGMPINKPTNLVGQNEDKKEKEVEKEIDRSIVEAGE
jgi:hypothetical protein